MTKRTQRRTSPLAGRDRWTTRRTRAHAFMREHGLSGLMAAIWRAGLRNSMTFAIRHARYGVCIYLGKRWDRLNGVDTGGQIELKDLAIVSSNAALGYAAVSTSPRTFGFLSRFFPQECSDFTYIDMGSGKGRTLLLAAQMGFRQIVGVEFAEELCVTARSNIAAYRESKELEDNFTVIHADATQFSLPPEKLVVYFCNPFFSELWPRMAETIVESLRSKPRQIYLVVAGSLPDTIAAAGRAIASSGDFRRCTSGTAPFYLDTYLPFDYQVFESNVICAHTEHTL